MIDYERFLRTRVDVLNDGGTRGYDQGIRTFDCPFCGDTKNRGWLGISESGAGCFNTGCDANPTLQGGAVEWARRSLGLISRGEAYRHLVEHFSTAIVTTIPVQPRGDDWCRLPAGMRAFEDEAFGDVHPFQDGFVRFIGKQWGLSLVDAIRWKLGWCAAGRHGNRVVIPIHYRKRLIGFQTRSIIGAEPKYLTSSYGHEFEEHAECGRPAAALLFNVDAIRTGQTTVLVEGAGDVMGWRDPKLPAVALLGTSLTLQKLDLLGLAGPGLLVVALDAEPAAQARARLYLADLVAWGLPATLGAWQGGKDAGSGAVLIYDALGQKVGSSRIERIKALRGEV